MRPVIYFLALATFFCSCHADVKEKDQLKFDKVK